MNERIDELFKQTALHRNDHTTEQRLYEVEKFAELIAKECANVCQQVTNNGMFDGNQQYASAYCRDEIKRYFGVKE